MMYWKAWWIAALLAVITVVVVSVTVVMTSPVYPVYAKVITGLVVALVILGCVRIMKISYMVGHDTSVTLNRFDDPTAGFYEPIS